MATWKGGILGPVEYSYPNPKEWTLENIPGRKQLDQITVKDITLALKTHKEPGCKASWEKRLKLETDIPWREIGRNIAHGIGTKKDTRAGGGGEKQVVVPTVASVPAVASEE